MRFEFATAGRIVFGAGAIGGIGAMAAEYGRRAMIVTGRSSTRGLRLQELLGGSGVTSVLFSVSGEPTTDHVRRAVADARAAACDLVVAIGGGSAVDAGKAIAALLANGGDPLDYLEVIGQGRALTRPSVPFIAVPTTAGTGAEVTRNAVLASAEHGVKASLRSPHMLPRLAVIDPELTYDVPPDVTAYTGLDALTQLIEPYVSSKANPMTDAFCREGLARAARSLRRACDNGRDPAARLDMCIAALLGGLALANAGLGAVHGFAGPIGGRFGAPHGAVCAGLLPHVMAANIAALRRGAGRNAVLARYDEIGQMLTGRSNAAAADAVEWAADLCRELGIPRLASFGVREADLDGLVENARRASSMKANPVELTPDELRGILRRAM